MSATNKRKRSPKKKLFSLAEANATLPLVRAIVKDIVDLAEGLRDRQERLMQPGRQPEPGQLGEAYEEESRKLQEDLERAQERMREYVQELASLGVELKDYYTGLVDFRAERDGREVYLCWKLGEPDVAHWHELDAGFSGRQKMEEEAHID